MDGILEANKGAGEGAGVERLQVFDPLADPDQHDR
jgi:hypothetical protein